MASENISLMASALDSGSSGPGLSPGQEHCIVLLSKTLDSHSVSPLRCTNGYQQFKCWRYPCNGLASHSGESRMFIVTSCYRNRDKLWHCGPLGSYAHFNQLVKEHYQVYQQNAKPKQMHPQLKATTPLESISLIPLDSLE